MARENEPRGATAGDRAGLGKYVDSSTPADVWQAYQNVNQPSTSQTQPPHEDCSVDVLADSLELYNTLSNRVGEVEGRLNKLSQDSEQELKKVREENKADTEQTRISFIETIGIFVALFTFISIEFQVFRVYSHWMAVVGLTLVLLGSIGILMWLLHYFLKIAHDDSARFRAGHWVVGWASVVVACGGAWLTALAPAEMDQDFERLVDDTVTARVHEELKARDADVSGQLSEMQDRIDRGDEALRACAQKFGVIKQCFE